MENICVIGFGSWGIALACLLEKNGHNVTMWEPNKDLADMLDKERENKRSLPGVLIPQSITITSDINLATASDLLLIALSSKDIPAVFSTMVPLLKKGQVLINASKGLIQNDGHQLRITEYLKETAPMCDVACLSGPSHAEEVSRNMPTMVTIASTSLDICRRLQLAFSDENFRVYTSTDLIGVELGGVLKNVIALAAGISNGLGFGDNTKAGLITRGIAEIARLGVAMGANIQTFAGLSGIGDLIVTCTSQHSRNWRAGNLLAQEKPVEQVLAEVNMAVEGINTAAPVLALANKYGVEMPIVEEVNQILYQGKKPKDAVISLMNRDAGSESKF